MTLKPPRGVIVRIVLMGVLSFLFSISAYAQEALWNKLNSRIHELYKQGRYSEAEDAAKNSLEVAERSFGSEHLNVAVSLNHLAGIYISQCRYDEAEALYKRSLSIREKALGLEHTSVAILLNNLAEIYRLQGKYAEAEALYKRALSIREKEFGSDSIKVAVFLEGMADFYNKIGREDEAVKAEESANKIRLSAAEKEIKSKDRKKRIIKQKETQQ